MDTKLKVTIDIEKQSGINVSGNFCISDILFSKYQDSTINADEMIKNVKQAIKSLKGFDMLTIRLNEGSHNDLYPREVHSVRFVNHFGLIKMATINGNCYENWVEVKEKYIYDNVKIFVDNANLLHKIKVNNTNAPSLN
jgi:hypothetical protein